MDCTGPSLVPALPDRERDDGDPGNGDRGNGDPGSGRYPRHVAVTLVYETHAITTDNEAGIATGWLPGALSARGRESAADLGARRRDDHIAAIYVSDLARARQTVEIAFQGTDIPIVIDERLRECNYGDLNGMPRARLEADRASHVEVPWPGGESYRMVVERTRTFLADVVARHEGDRILVVAHSANRLALDHLLRGRALHELIDEPFEWQPGWEYELRPAE